MKKVIFLAALIAIFAMTLSAQNKTDLLILINGKVSNVDLSSIDPNTIESVSLIKDQAAINIYGEAAKNGVILVITKDFLKPIKLPKTLIIVNGKKSFTHEEIKTLVLKNLSATKVYGGSATKNYGEARNAVILVTSKRK
jgi:TonB-dependent SusC/RagA subfamily outer membrane receptor